MTIQRKIVAWYVGEVRPIELTVDEVSAAIEGD
jgi:hypothetical protein